MTTWITPAGQKIELASNFGEAPLLKMGWIKEKDKKVGKGAK